MATRQQLQTKLEEILGSRNVYFQPPENFRMKYPCIVYGLSHYDTLYADDDPYAFFKAYQITLIERDPESPTIDELLKLRYCKFDRTFVLDDLYHYVYRIYY